VDPCTLKEQEESIVLTELGLKLLSLVTNPSVSSQDSQLGTVLADVAESETEMLPFHTQLFW